jgi:nucleosome binding factor SPN SPT16 subunit
MEERNTYRCNDILAERIIISSLRSADRSLNRNTPKKRLEHNKKLHEGNIELLLQKLTIGDLVDSNAYDRARATIENLKSQILVINSKLAGHSYGFK